MKNVLLHLLQILSPIILIGLTAGFFWLAERLVQLVDKARAWVRWFCVMPGALLFAFMTAFPLHWIIRIVSDRDPDDRWFSPSTGETIERYAIWLIVPFAFVFAGARIAPRGRLGTAVTLTVVVLLSAALLFYQTLFIGGYEIYDQGKFFVSWTLLALGLGCGIYFTVKRLKE